MFVPLAGWGMAPAAQESLGGFARWNPAHPRGRFVFDNRMRPDILNPFHSENQKLGGGNGADMSDTTTYRDLTGLSVLLKGSLGGYMAVAAIGLWSGWLEIDLLQRAANGAAVTEAEAAASDSRQALLGGLYFLVFLITGIMFLRWTYLSNRNARALGASGMQFTPGWAVGWYFIPVAHLWKPYQAFKETFKASHPDFVEDWREAPHPTILPLWWTLWIMASFVGQAVLRTTLRAETVEQLLASSWLTFISDSLDLPLGLVAIAIVGKLQSWQSEKRRVLCSHDAQASGEHAHSPSA
jgi:hypothetical protein